MENNTREAIDLDLDYLYEKCKLLSAGLPTDNQEDDYLSCVKNFIVNQGFSVQKARHEAFKKVMN